MPLHYSHGIHFDLERVNYFRRSSKIGADVKKNVLSSTDSPGGGIRYCNIGEADSIHNSVWALRVGEELLLTTDKLP